MAERCAVIGVGQTHHKSKRDDVSIAGLVREAAKMALAVAARELRREKIRVIDVRAPHSETGLVNRARAGAAPRRPEGLDPQVVVDRVLEAITLGEKDLPVEAFASLTS